MTAADYAGLAIAVALAVYAAIGAIVRIREVRR